jgi:NTP pyrophosphatase (non-canonical NTP hydrolase)
MKRKGWENEKEIKVTIQDLQNKAFGNAIKHGFHHKEQNHAEMLCLIHSEISEALEADRTNKRADLKRYLEIIQKKPESTQWAFQNYVKDTLEDELADAMIRIADMAGYLEIDLETHIREKMKFNENRPFKHGKEY